MHKILASLHQDHIHLSQLLTLLKSQSDAFSSGEQYDILLIIDIVDYIQRYSDKVHHPREDVIYKVYLEQSDEAADTAELLLHDHQTLPAATIEFRNILENVINTDISVNREELSTKIYEFIDLQTQHMDIEESRFFSLIDTTLDTDDWRAISTQLPETNDPLFGEHVIDEYQYLQHR